MRRGLITQRFVGAIVLGGVISSAVLVGASLAAGTGSEICTDAASCKAGDFGTLGGEFHYAYGVAADSAGNVYTTESNRVQQFDSLGSFERAWGKGVAGGSSYGICTVAASCFAGDPFPGGSLGGEFWEAEAAAADAVGNVYVADLGRIQKFDSSGNFLRTWGKDVIQSGHPGDTGTGFEICTVAADCSFGQQGSLGGEFDGEPDGIAVEASGSAYVFGNDRIQKFDSSGNFQRAWGKDVIQSGHPGDTGTGFEICTVAADCEAGATFGQLGGEFGAGGYGVAVDGANNVYVADYWNDRIQKFDSSGNFLRTWGKDVIQSGHPGDIGTGFEICIVAADCQAGTIGMLGGEFFDPRGLAVLPR